MKINPIINENSITVFPFGTPITVRQDNPNFYALRKACKEKNWEAIERLSTVEKTIEKAVSTNKSLSESVEIKNGQVLYKGKPLHDVVSQKLLSMIRQGQEDATPWVLFVEKLMKNPDRNSVEQLYNFLSYKELPIDSEGNVIGYKGVRNDYWSKSGNVDTRVIQGKVDESGHIWNGVGETIEIERNCVVNNPNEGCAEGIHIGSFDYAKDWAGSCGRLVLVKFSPTDAVSVPSNEIQKLRACKYVVVADVTDMDTDIKRSYVPDVENIEKIHVSDDDLYEAIEEALVDYLDDEITVDLLEEEGLIPYGSDVTDARIDKYFVEDDDENTTNMVEERIIKYVKNNRPVTIKQIQSSMSGFCNVPCHEILDVCLDAGFKVKPKVGPISKRVVK